MNERTRVLRNFTRQINRIKIFGASALEDNGIITCKRFYSVSRTQAMSFLDHAITDLENARNELDKNGKIKFRSNNYIELFRKIGLIVEECYYDDLAHIAYINEEV